MTLKFFKNNKSDNRMIEYDRSIVRLGLEKSAAQAELERLLLEVDVTSSRYAALLNEITVAEKRLGIIQQEVIEAVRVSIEKVAGLSRAQNKSGQALNDKTKELKQLKDYLTSLQAKIVIESDTLNVVNQRVQDMRDLLKAEKQELNKLIIDKQSIEKDIISLQEVKQELRGVIAASEERVSYLSEKEQFLNRKETDLIKYEKRVEKLREDTGNKNRMIFK